MSIWSFIIQAIYLIIGAYIFYKTLDSLIYDYETYGFKTIIGIHCILLLAFNSMTFSMIAIFASLGIV